MRIEIDQSGKVGDTHVSTVLALSNTASYSILLSPTVNRECIKYLRARYRKLRQPYLKLFAAALFVLLKDHLRKFGLIIIDKEYTGHEAAIKGMLVVFIRAKYPNFATEQIMFGHIGKRSRAHEKAYATFRAKS